MSHLSNARETALNKATLDAIRRDLVMRWQRRIGKPYILELVTVYTTERGTERTRVLYQSDSPYRCISARAITDKARAMDAYIRINDPEDVCFQQVEEIYPLRLGGSGVP